MRQAAKNKSVELPPTFYILDVSLLNPTELPDEAVEKKFWSAHPTLGGYINWPIVGSFRNASTESASAVEQKAKTLNTWSVDKLPEKVALLTSYLSEQSSQGGNVSTVIYIHCEAGTDRTGEVSASYYMKVLNQSFHDALEYDDHINSRVIKPLSQNALQWYDAMLLSPHQPLRCRLGAALPLV